jgi:arylsulfatase
MNQLDWLCGKTEASKREGYLYWMGPQLYGAKWRNFKLVLKEQRYMFDPVETLPLPRLVNLTTDPQERERISLPHLHTWAAYHLNHIIGAFQESVRREPLVPMGAPLGHVVSHSSADR